MDTKIYIPSSSGILGVIGDPIEHSLSPLLHNHLINKLGLDYTYLKLHVPTKYGGDIGIAVRALGFKGVNVTIPHKRNAAALVDYLTEEARKVGAVNTIGVGNNRKLIGHNTDIAGFTESLRLRGLAENLNNGYAVVFGAGGASRAILCGLQQLGVNRITVVNRSTERATMLIKWFNRAFKKGAKTEILSPENIGRINSALEKATILVNITPLGMHPDIGNTPLPDGVNLSGETLVYDTIYNPMETKLLREASSFGCQTVNGLDMLIIQGIRSLSWWTGKEIAIEEHIDELRELLIGELNKKG